MPKLLQWVLCLQQFDIKIVCIKGAQNIADCLSKIDQTQIIEDGKEQNKIKPELAETVIR